MIDSKRVFAIVVKPGDCGEINYELIMMKCMMQSVGHTEHPVVVIVNTDQEKIKDADVLAKIGQILATPPQVSDKMLEPFDGDDFGQGLLKSVHIEIIEYTQHFLPRRVKNYVNVYYCGNHWPRVCQWKHRTINRQMRLLQKKDCR